MNCYRIRTASTLSQLAARSRVETLRSWDYISL